MKKRLLFIFIAVFSLFVFSDRMNAQGIYSDKGNGESEESSESGIRKLPSKPSVDPGSADTPVGEGIFILSVLAGGSVFVKKIKKSKKGGYEA
jgi:hypothetical protein